jgi:hypothetical protein
VALLGTIGPLHSEVLQYDLNRLRRVVEDLEPDLLGVEMDPGAWQRGELSGASVEVRDALVPAARALDTVIVPLGNGSHPAVGSRGLVARGLDAWLVAMQRRLDGPAGIDAPLFKHTCGLICELEALAADEAERRAWEASNAHILNRVLWMVRRDPGRRVLVAVQCRRVHWLERRLRQRRDELLLVPHTTL